MKYYVIRHSGNVKIIGHYPQTKEISHNCHIWDEPKFIEHVHFSKIEFKPIVSTPILHNKAKLTDLIHVIGVGFTLKLLISGRFKNILEKRRQSGVQYFSCPVIQKDKVYEHYYLLNMFENGNHFIDIKSCRIRHDKKAKDYDLTYSTTTEYLRFEDFKAFNTSLELALNNQEFFFIDKISLIKNVNEDFFMLTQVEGGVKYVVSETLKIEIDKSGCTGIEFQPIEFTLTEWLQGGEREKVYGKT